jgi:16S rRNA processing protein RimM
MLRDVLLSGARSFPDEPRIFQVERVWEHGDRLIFKFQGVDSISEAEALEDAFVCVPLSERMPAQEGEYYLSDLIGCEVVERSGNDVLGRVTDWLQAGGSGLLEVTMKEAGETLLIPFAKSICVRIDTSARRIVVDLPEGLKDFAG